MSSVHEVKYTIPAGSAAISRIGKSDIESALRASSPRTNSYLPQFIRELEIHGVLEVAYNQYMRKVLMVASLSMAAIIVICGLVVISFQVLYWGRVFPGVTIQGQEIGGYAPEGVRAWLVNNTNRQEIELVSGSYRRTITRDELGVVTDYDKTATQAMTAGREGEWWTMVAKQWAIAQDGQEITVQINWNEKAVEQVILDVARALDVPAIEPQIAIDRGLVTVNPGENGQVVEDQKLKEQLWLAFVTQNNRIVEIPIKKLTPKLSEDQVTKIQAQAQTLVNKKIVLQDGVEKWEILGEELVTWLAVDGSWKQREIEQYIQELAKGVNRPAQNAAFRFEGGKVVEFKPAIAGREIRQTELAHTLATTASQVTAGLSEDNVTIPVIATEPTVKTEQVNNLGIKELIAKGESRFTGSIPNRVFNIKKAAASMDGVLIAPGETFSFNKHVGDISAASGYKQGYIIKDGQTILGDGGGVCQVSSTMFRAALAAGLEVEERWAHAYRVSYYEQDIGPGYDATIFTPSVDLKFKNDTPAYILIQTKLDEANYRLAFEFYGTSDGRKVEYSMTRVWDRTPLPPTIYKVDATLARGVTKLAEHAIWGSKVAFDWTVHRDGGEIQ